MIVYPNCKINIGLKVLNKRKDGYHNLESVFIPIPWHDALEIIENKSKSKKIPKVTFSTSGLTIDGAEENNLCIKAYHLLDNIYQLPAIKMHLHKNIPMGAGLGGGSSDGAFALKLLNELFQLNLTSKQLQTFAAKLGSDCAFFIRNKPSFVTGRGEKLKNLKLDLDGKYIVIVHPGIHINTAAAFRNIIKTKYKKPLQSLPELKIKTWKSNIDNDFEGFAFATYPVLKKLKEELYDKGALYASMSGSGSAVYGIFEKKIALPNRWEKYTLFEGVI